MRLFTQKPKNMISLFLMGNNDEGSFVGGTFEDMVQKIKFVLKMQDFNTFERILQHNFELPE